ncbi:carotenoid 1,2-hydratase [Pelomicrobium methylotrophicum]|uniref:Carotenoid 1,2-hydratase n=1 Tax=Pelomicrobium methylotrophicum TaxID=2602750 RepID=A0A5C7F0B7_9PROT|nr:carotenoid 1,2-hydratase [Pelomicrobium methylotrophicum]
MGPARGAGHWPGGRRRPHERDERPASHEHGSGTGRAGGLVKRLAAWLALWLTASTAAAGVNYPPVVPGRALTFPADEGSHPAFRIEWWYVTGWLTTENGAPLGFQVTFFRNRPDFVTDNPSRFTPRQLLFAHAALSDPALGRLLHDQRSAREGFGLAYARTGRVEVAIDDWSLTQEGTTYRATIPAQGFRLDLLLERTQPPLRQGRDGFSQKGPRERSASYYYSLPHLRVTGTVERDGRRLAVTGEAWFDHEWSSTLMDKEAVGWDWIGINLSDGGALMAFRMRTREGKAHWAGGTLRRPDGTVRTFGPHEVEFIPGRRWTSPRSGITYPVEWTVRAGSLTLRLKPLMDDQESDSRASTGTIYWEGAVEALAGDRGVGRGYLELTGYGKALNL